MKIHKKRLGIIKKKNRILRKVEKKKNNKQINCDRILRKLKITPRIT